jgi:two-component system CheB/CheR fusion protein
VELQGAIRDLEVSNEEQKAINEEAMSVNEEFQSTNEELETSKEELESANEELTTLNDEMAHGNAELSRANADLNNLHASVNLPILVLTRDLAIRRFTPPAANLFNLVDADAGRPLSNVRHNLDLPDLEALLKEVIDTISEREREVRDKTGRCYSLRARPYLTLDNKIDGSVLVLVDIDALKRSEQAMAAALDYAANTIKTVRDSLLMLDADLRVQHANEAFYKTFQVSPAESEGRLFFDLGNGQWKIPRLRQLLEGILPRNSFFNDYEVTHDFERVGRRTMLLNARKLAGEGAAQRILVGIHDITEILQFQAATR